jgi:hypothetical protein
MVGYHGIQLLLDFAQDAWRVNSWKVAVNVLVDDFDQRQKFSER